MGSTKFTLTPSESYVASLASELGSPPTIVGRLCIEGSKSLVASWFKPGRLLEEIVLSFYSCMTEAPPFRYELLSVTKFISVTLLMPEMSFIFTPYSSSGLLF
jgi:hypothetical protein